MEKYVYIKCLLNVYEDFPLLLCNVQKNFSLNCVGAVSGSWNKMCDFECDSYEIVLAVNLLSKRFKPFG
jgi:hypothetical protein